MTLLSLLLACPSASLTEPDPDLLRKPDTGTEDSAAPDPADCDLPELSVTVADVTEHCDEGFLVLDVGVSNSGLAPAPVGIDVEVYSLPELVLVASTVTASGIAAGAYGTTVQLTVDIEDIGAGGLQVVVDGDDQVEEHDLWPNTVDWDALCCEAEPESLGEIWGVASAWNGDILALEGPLASLGERPGGVIWRLDLDTMQPHIVRVFDPDDSDIWYLGTLALHPSEPIVYVTAYSYASLGTYDSDAWLDGGDTLIAVDTITYDVLETWDLDPDPYSFTGLGTDFVDGQDGLYSPADLVFFGDDLYAIEGMTVEHPDLVALDPVTGSVGVTELGPTFADGLWGGGVETDSAGVHHAVCSETPPVNLDADGYEIAYVPEALPWIEYDPAAVNDCDDPLFTFELDRVHGLATGDDDTLYAGRTSRGHWYDEAAEQDTDLTLYTVGDDGTMTPFYDLTNLMATVWAPIDGIGGMDWRPKPTTGVCTDGLDNDQDGWIDMADPDCQVQGMETGFGTTECNDGVDNDGDTAVDAADPSCDDAWDTSETI
jgi:hypothetical protein